MDEIGAYKVGTLGPEPPDSSAQPRKVSRLLLLWPLAGFVALAVAVASYQPLDDTPIWWIGGLSCLIIYALINISWRKAQSGEESRSLLPRSLWLAIGSLLVPTVLFLNGVLDHSPVEQHRQVVIRTIVAHGRGGSASYYLEVESWRAGRTYEKVMVSEGWYLAARTGDIAIVETHRGGLGIPLLVSVSVHRPD
jgi:hypothetical protein